MITLYSYPPLFGVADNNGYGLSLSFGSPDCRFGTNTSSMRQRRHAGNYLTSPTAIAPSATARRFWHTSPKNTARRWMLH